MMKIKDFLKILIQFGIIVIIWQIGEMVSNVIAPLIVLPGSICGLIILLILLSTGIIKEKHIKEFADILLKNIALFFIPVSVGILSYLDIISANLMLIIVTGVVGTIISLGIVMKIADIIFLRVENK